MAVDTIGTPVLRKEDPRFNTRTGSYLDDVKLSNVAHAAILRSPYAQARIRGIGEWRHRPDSASPTQAARDNGWSRHQQGGVTCRRSCKLLR